MNDKYWSSGNSFLRHLESSREDGDILSMDTQSLQELLSALASIQMYVKRMSTGKAKIEIRPGMINISIESSKEMLS